MKQQDINLLREEVIRVWGPTGFHITILDGLINKNKAEKAVHRRRTQAPQPSIHQRVIEELAPSRFNFDDHIQTEYAKKLPNCS